MRTDVHVMNLWSESKPVRNIYIEGDYLVLNVRYPYEIELSRLNTPLKAFHFLVHLLEKNWVDRRLLFNFVSILEKHFGYDLHSICE
jgi:hypothetical protein